MEDEPVLDTAILDTEDEEEVIETDMFFGAPD
jgi:hypothetical protein